MVVAPSDHWTDLLSLNIFWKRSMNVMLHWIIYILYEKKKLFLLLF